MPQTDAYNLRIEGPAKDARFYMSTAPAMPSITLVAKIDNAPLKDLAVFNWKFSLAYDSYITTKPGQRTYQVRVKTHPPMPPITGPQVSAPLTTLMCGRLVVTLTTLIAGKYLTTTRNDILIGGTNPNAGELAGAVTDALVRKLIKHESGGNQFYDSGTSASETQAINPNWSRDDLRGVGLGQLTNPAPDDADIWNWRQNARSLQNRFKSNRTSADSFAKNVAASARFKNEVAALDAWRKAENQPALTVTVPALTTDQRDCEALRRYNGLGPSLTEDVCYLRATDSKGNFHWQLHEFEPAMTEYTSASRKDDKGAALMSKLLAVNASGAITWSQISGAERRKRYAAAGKTKGLGDPEYVANVLAKSA